jgi:uroporphyrinogen decarboxylase
MRKETMLPRERWLAVLRRKKPDRMPMDYWATEETNRKLMSYLRVGKLEEVYEKLHIDVPVTVHPRYIGPEIPEGADVYGCRLKRVRYSAGVYDECVFHPLARYGSVAEIEKNYRWPRIDWYDYSVIPEQIKGRETYPIKGGGSEPFLTYKYLRGQEQAFKDLIVNPDIVDYCLNMLFDFSYEDTKRIYEQIPNKVMITYVAEDLGSQEDLMYSPEHIRRFLIPGMKRMIDLAHSAGAFAFHHSDGAVRRIIPDMIEAGIDILNPIQWRCKGMEREGLKRDFGDRLIFHGGVDNQRTLPFGTVEDVKKEVTDNIRILGQGGGHILAPCHNIQSITPLENIVAMYETGYERGWS